MNEKFFGHLKKNECLKRFAFSFWRVPSVDDSQSIFDFFECVPDLQSLKLTIHSVIVSPSFFKCLEECVSRSSLEKLHLKVSSCKKCFLFRLCLLTHAPPDFWEQHKYVSGSLSKKCQDFFASEFVFCISRHLLINCNSGRCLTEIWSLIRNC